MIRLRVLHHIARLMGIQFKVNGLPYGAEVEDAISKTL